jgi:EthD domain
MVKVQGLGRRHPGISHADCIEHHRNTHSQLGLGQAEHMAGYVLYYFREAFGSDGTALPDFPWDMSALEWFREDSYWDNFQKWLESAPDGQEVKKDEATFLDRDKCFLCPYEDRVVVTTHAHGDVIDLLRLLSFSDGISDEAGADYHARICVPAIQAHFGDTLRKLVVNTITEATCLAIGKIPNKPVNVIELYKLDRVAFASAGALVGAITAPAIAKAEASIFAADRTINMVAEEVVFSPLERAASALHEHQLLR